MRVAVLGNSHLAALILGWRDIRPAYPGISLTFFGATKSAMRGLRAQNDRLVPGNDKLRADLIRYSGGLDHIASDFDAYVLAGMGYSFPLMVHLLSTHRLSGDDWPVVSERFLCEGVKVALANAAGSHVLRRLQQITGRPTIFVPAPFVSTAALTVPRYSYWKMQDQVRAIFHVYTAELELLRRSCTIFSQPVETIEPPWFTREEFSRGSVVLKGNLNAEHAANDVAHMNANFGVVCLREILDNYLLEVRDHPAKTAAADSPVAING